MYMKQHNIISTLLMVLRFLNSFPPTVHSFSNEYHKNSFKHQQNHLLLIRILIFLRVTVLTDSIEKARKNKN